MKNLPKPLEQFLERGPDYAHDKFYWVSSEAVSIDIMQGNTMHTLIVRRGQEKRALKQWYYVMRLVEELPNFYSYIYKAAYSELFDGSTHDLLFDYDLVEDPMQAIANDFFDGMSIERLKQYDPSKALKLVEVFNS